MTRTYIRHTLSALAAAAFLSAFAAGPVVGGSTQHWQDEFMALTKGTPKADSDAKLVKLKTPKGLATPKPLSSHGPSERPPLFVESDPLD